MHWAMARTGKKIAPIKGRLHDTHKTIRINPTGIKWMNRADKVLKNPSLSENTSREKRLRKAAMAKVRRRGSQRIKFLLFSWYIQSMIYQTKSRHDFIGGR